MCESSNQQRSVDLQSDSRFEAHERINNPKMWEYQGQSIWKTNSGSFVKLDQIMIYALSDLEQRVLGAIALYQLHLYDVDLERCTLSDRQDAGNKKAVRKLSEQFRVLTALDVRQPVNQRKFIKLEPISLLNNLPEDKLVTSGKKTMGFAVEALDLDVHSDIERFTQLKNKYEQTFASELIKQSCDYILKHGLETEGIFRKAASKKRLNELKDTILYSGKVSLNEETNIHEVAGLLKEWLKDFNVIPEEVHNAFLSTCEFFHRERVHLLKLLVFQLPQINLRTLYTLLHTLHSVHTRAYNHIDELSEIPMAGNKMDAQNLAIVFAPSLLLSSHHSDPSMTCANSKKLLDQATCVVKTMIEHYETLFKVPSRMHNEILKVISRSYPEELNSILFNKLLSGIGIISSRVVNSDKFKD